MIQRIQSVWLLTGSGLCVFNLHSFPFTPGLTKSSRLLVYELNGRENFLLILATFITGALAAVSNFFI